MALLEPYLAPSPEENPVNPAGGYAEGGSLYALGLIHGSNAACDSNKRKEACDYLRNHLRRSHANEVISHGAALGVGSLRPDRKIWKLSMDSKNFYTQIVQLQEKRQGLP